MSATPSLATPAPSLLPDGTPNLDTPRYLVKFHISVAFGAKEHVGNVEDVTYDEAVRFEDLFRGRYPDRLLHVKPGTQVFYEAWPVKRDGRVMKPQPEFSGKFTLPTTEQPVPIPSYQPGGGFTPYAPGSSPFGPQGPQAFASGQCPFCGSFLFPGVRHECPMAGGGTSGSRENMETVELRRKLEQMETERVRERDQERRDRERERAEEQRAREEERHQHEEERRERDRERADAQRQRDEERREHERQLVEERRTREAAEVAGKTETRFEVLLRELKDERTATERAIQTLKGESDRQRDDLKERIERQAAEHRTEVERLIRELKDSARPKMTTTEIATAVATSLGPLVTLYTEAQRVSAAARADADRSAADRAGANEKTLHTMIQQSNELVRTLLTKQPESRVFADIMTSYANTIGAVGDITTRMFKAGAGEQGNPLHELGHTALNGIFGVWMNYLRAKQGLAPIEPGQEGEEPGMPVAPHHQIQAPPPVATLPPGIPGPATQIPATAPAAVDPRPASTQPRPPQPTAQLRASSDEIIFRTRVLPEAAQRRDPRIAAEFIVTWAERAHDFNLTEPGDPAYDPTISLFFPTEKSPDAPEKWVLTFVGEWTKSEWFDGQSGEAAKFAPAVWRAVQDVMREQAEEPKPDPDDAEQIPQPAPAD